MLQQEKQKTNRLVTINNYMYIIKNDKDMKKNLWCFLFFNFITVQKSLEFQLIDDNDVSTFVSQIFSWQNYDSALNVSTL